MELGATLYIRNTNEAVAFYQDAFGMTLGYSKKFPDGTYLHAELQKDGKTIFAVSEHDNEKLVSHMRMQVMGRICPTTSLGIGFSTEGEVRKAYECLLKEGVVFREIGELPWSKCSADILDKYDIHM